MSVCQLAQCRSGDSLYSVVGLSELLVKLEISLTLSGEIDNSNVKEVEEVQGSTPKAVDSQAIGTRQHQINCGTVDISVAYHTD